jgi:hypothetical protein
MTAPTAHSILRDYLTTHGYDGLYWPGECACLVDDFAPCGDIPRECRPGWRVPCDGTCDAGRCQFHVSDDPANHPTADADSHA